MFITGSSSGKFLSGKSGAASPVDRRSNGHRASSLSFNGANDVISQFIGLDIPFLMTERRDRRAFERIMDRADVAVSEKFADPQAYQIERLWSDYETYGDTIEIDGTERIVIC